MPQPHHGSSETPDENIDALRDEIATLQALNRTLRDEEELQRERNRQAVGEREARLQAVLDTAVDGIITIDERGMIESLNKAALTLFGYAAEELIGKNVSILMPQPYKGEHDGYLANYLRTGQARIIGIGREVVGQRKDGSTFPMELAVSEVKTAGKRLFTGIVRNIAARKETERQLREAVEKAEAANRAKDHFLAIVSHELRTPLNPILATVSYLEHDEEMRARLRDELATIRRNVEHEARLVEDLLNLTRLQRDKIELHYEAVDAHTTARNALAQFQQDIDAKEIELTTRLWAQQYHLWADPWRLGQVLSNLIGNAVKFTPRGGQITLRSCNPREGRLRIDVSDSGVGIEPGALARIFRPFEQAEVTTSRRFGGLGLGLVIAKGIVDLHRGTIKAHSDGKDQGATFSVEFETLPVMPEAEAAAQAASSGPKLLLVEDHADTLRIMAKLLRGMGYQVWTAASVSQALELGTKQKFSLLVSDIGLPDGSGLDVMQALAKNDGVKGIALSGFCHEEDRLRSLHAGFAEHLTKPVNFKLFEQVLRRVQAN